MFLNLNVIFILSLSRVIKYYVYCYQIISTNK
jgi:hypothetical protein